MMWPNGKLYYESPNYEPWVPPTKEEQLETRAKAAKYLKEAIDAYFPMLGRDYCMRGASKFLEFLQLDALLKHLAYFFLDRLFSMIFPNTKGKLKKVHVDLANFMKKKRAETKRKAERMRAQVALGACIAYNVPTHDSVVVKEGEREWGQGEKERELE